MSEVVTFPARLPVAAQCPGSAPARPAERPLPPDAQLRVGVHHATKMLQPFVPSRSTDLKCLARVVATTIAVNAPQSWSVADLVDWLTVTAPTETME